MAGAAVAAPAASYAAGPAGIALTFSQIGVQYVLDTLTPLVEASLGNISLPDLNTSSNDVNIQINNAGCHSFSMSQTPVASISSSSGLTIVAVGMTLSCSLDWAFQTASWPYTPSGSGSATGDVTSATGVVGVLLTSNGSVPVLNATDVTLILGGLTIDFNGSAWDWLLGLLRDLFKSAIQNSVADALAGVVAGVIDTTLNAALAGIDFNLPLPLPPPYNISQIQFGLASDPTFNANFIGFPLLGDVVPIAAPSPPPLTPPSLPSFGAASGASYLQLFLTPYTAQSAAYTFMTAGLLNWFVPAAQVPLGLNNTAAYSIIAPGMPTAYPNAPVSLAIDVPAVPNMTISAQGITVQVLLDVEFIVNTDTAAFTLCADTGIAVQVQLVTNATTGALAIGGHMAYASSNLTLVSTTVGAVSVGLLQALIDFVTGGIVLPAVNALLASGIPLPALPFLSLYNTFLFNAEGYMVLATDFTFAAPARLRR